MATSKQFQNRNFAGIYREEVGNYKGYFYLVLLHLLITVNHRDNPDFVFNNKQYPLKRGQLITSIKSLVNQTGLSVKNVRTVLKNLENSKILAISSAGILANRATLITFTDIDKYLVKPQEVANQVANQVANEWQTGGKQVATNNNDNNNNNDNKSITYSNTSTTSNKANPDITLLVEYLKQKTELTTLDGTIKDNRYKAHLLLQKLRKNYPDYDSLKLAKQLIDIALSDKFHSQNLTSVGYLYYNMNKIIQVFKSRSQKNSVYKVN